MTNTSLIQFEKGNIIYLIIDNKVNTNKIYQILDIDCETYGSMITGHQNVYYALLADMTGENVFRTIITTLDLLTERSENYAVKVLDVN